MKMSEGKTDILSMLSGHELAIKRLYEVFSASFPKYEGFWRNLAADEQKHSDWLEMLRSDPVTAGLLQDQIQLKPQAIKTSTGYLDGQVEKTHAGAFSLMQALSIARDLETALIERLFSKLRLSPSEKIRSIISELTDETEKHRYMLNQALEAEKRQTP
jgi:rubrerythrin